MPITVGVIVYAVPGLDDPIEVCHQYYFTPTLINQKNSLKNSQSWLFLSNCKVFVDLVFMEMISYWVFLFLLSFPLHSLLQCTDIKGSDYHFYASTFEYLKTNSMDLVMTAGNSEWVFKLTLIHTLSNWFIFSVGSVVKAIHEGGASRISGAFTAHTFPRYYCF